MFRYIGLLASCLLIAALTWQVTFTGAVVNETIGDLTFECPDRWVAARGGCYLAVETAMTWDHARTSCMNANGSELVQANDVQYAEIVRPNAPTSHPDHLFWIGLNRIYEKDEGQAAWGEIGNYPLWQGLWNNNEPNFEVGVCVAGSSNSFWAVKDCDMKLPFMCQYPACLKGYFRCENGRGCLNPKWQCDGENDCGDNSDEKNCPSRCQFVIITGEKSSDTFQVSSFNNSRECVWTIEAPVGKRIKTNLPALTIEEMADFLQVWTGSSSLSFITSTLLANMTGNLQPSTFFSSNNFIFIRLVMDDSIIRTTGFSVNWTTYITELEQSRNMTATTTWQELTSPFYGQFTNLLNLDLEWTITSDNDVISIEFLEMDILGSLTVRDGDTVALSNLTSVPNPSIYISRKRTIQMRMKTDIGNGKGFKLRYKKGCSLVISAYEGIIQSPGFTQDAYNRQYPNNVSCQWILNVTAIGKGMTLRFTDFSLNSADTNSSLNSTDIVQVFINSSETAVHSGMGFTGNQLPDPVKSNEGIIKLKFITDQALTDTGFSAKFSIDCPKVKANVPEFTVWNATSYSFEIKVPVSCVNGYSFRQEEYSKQSQVMMTCLSGGQWDLERIPDCQITYCGVPPAIDNGYIANATGVTYNKTARYECNSNFRREGADMAVCSDSGSWINISSCTSAACSSIGNLTFGLITSEAGNISSGQFGSVAKFVCNDGYELKGIQYSYCNGTAWSHKKIPQCIKLKCPSPVIRNSIALSPAVVEFGGNLNVTCASGFRLSHNRTVLCLSNQTFNDLPECIDIDECQSLPCSSNTEVCVNILGSYRCDCKPGYMKPPSGTGNCTDINECNTNNGGCNQICNNYAGSYQCQCIPGYDLYIRNGSNEILLAPSETGLIEGDTYYINHTCVRKLCNKPQVPVNGMILTVKENFYFGEEILYICNVGYSFYGGTQNLTRQCNVSGLWTGVDPVCTVMQCPGFPVVKRGQFKGSGWISFGDQVNLECQYTNTTYINKTIICGYKNGILQLLGDSMKCPVIDCGPVIDVLPIGANKSIFNSSSLFLDNPSFIFSCMPGYEARGQSESGGMIVTCKENGRWSLGSLTCIGKTCTDPGTPGGTQQNATSYEIGQKVSYTCSRIGFQPDPPGPIECVYNSTSGNVSWSTSSRPVCKDITPPIFTDCNEDIYVDVMEQVVFGKSFNVTDNSGGIKQVTYNKAVREGDVISVATVLVVTATDFSDNNATCLKNISVKNRSLKPNLTCPDYLVLDVMNASSTIYNIQDFISVSAGNIKNITPSTVAINYTTYLLYNMMEITAVAENTFFTEKACTFLVSTRLSACFPEVIPDDPHGNKTVSVLSSGSVNISLICADGYGYQNGSVTQVALCSPGGLWSPVLPLQTCIKYTNPYFQINITVEFRLNTLSRSCKENHDSQLRARNITLENEFLRICGIQWTITSFATITDAFKIITAFSVNLNDLTVINGTRTACVNNLRATLSSNLSTSIYDYGNLTCNGTTYTLDVTAVKVDESPGLTCDPDKTLTNTDRGLQCLPCAPGNYYGQNSCVSCPIGTYQETYGQTACKNCPDGYTPALQKTYCQKLCPVGFTSINGFPPCTPCPVDSYWNDSRSCVTCPPGYSTVDNEGAKDQQQCKAPCGPGTFSITGYMPCMPCPLNFYQNEMRGSTCKRCPFDSTTSVIGSNSSSNCQNQTCNATVQCYGHGTCMYNEHKPVCSCYPGYYGDRCETPVHICDSQPCLNGGVCNSSAAYNVVQCTCPKDSKCSMGSIQNQTYGGDDYDGSRSGLQSSQAACEKVCLDYAACVALAYTEGFCIIYTNLSLIKPGPNDAFVMLYKNCDLLFVGNRCETDNINECASNPCSQYGMCQNLVNGSKCLCPIYGNYQLPRCERTSNFCNSNPCQNGGTCQQFDSVRYECTCRPGFTGQNCETNVDDCKENPDGCLYGGMCNDWDNKYNCSCMNRFSGDHCSLSPSYCPGPCPHVNLCYNDFNNFTARCSCSYPYETKYLNVCKISTSMENRRIPEQDGYSLIGSGATVVGCEQACVRRTDCRAFTFYQDDLACIGYSNDSKPLEIRINATYYTIGCSDVDSGQCQLIDSCRNITCANNGTCTNGRCMCKAGFTGFTCQHSIDDCLSNPCPNGGICIDGYLSYTCQCAKGYNGTNCESNINDCKGNCTSNGSSSCVDLVDDYNCTCKPGYSGKNCEVNINDCASYPCQHGGVCTDLVNDYQCNCSDTVGWGGKNCSQPINQCSSLPCKNDAPCYSLEDTFFCRCPGNTKGVTCETGLPVCNVVTNPCTNNGSCQEKEGSASCSCQLDYTGTACQLVKDWCNLENGTSVCKNGGECMSLEPLGYKCQCITGYSGVNCEIAANPCDSNPCKGGSTCRSTITDYICQCPQGKPYVEMQCKNVSTNYDIVFDERMAVGTMLETAHRLEGSQMSLMMWFRFHSVGGKVSTNATLIYITGNKGADRYRQPSDDGFHVIVTVNDVTVGNGFTSTTLMMPAYTPPSFLTNGNWHHFALTMNGKIATVVVDGLQTDAMADYSLDLNLNTQVFIGLMYTGEISQVTVWNSALSYSDILRYFGNVSYVPNGMMAQGWWSYVFHPGVSRQYPSQVKCDSCKPLPVDKTPPQAVCNRDPYTFTVYTITDRFVTLEQQNLRSKANFTGYNVSSTLPQDATYPLGQYDAIFVAKDESGNYQDCRFPIYVKYYENCTLPQTDANLIKYKYNGMEVDSIFALNCTNTSYGPTAALPRYIPCGVLGVYDAKNPYMDRVLPSCGYKAMNNYQIDVQMQYQLQAQCSDLFLSSLIISIKKKFNDTTTNGIIRQFCDGSDCPNIIVTGNCTNVNALIAIQIYLNRGFISSGQVNYTLTEATRIIVLVERKFIFPTIADSKWLEDTVVISERKICNTGSSFLNGACFECGKGMFSNNQTGLCEFCAIGTYQQFRGKESCVPCNSSQTTRNIGSMAATDCISVCPKGQYYKYSTTTLMGYCQKCPRHFYQDEDGQSFCKPCPFKNITAEEGANSSTQCQDDCLSGEEPASGSDAPCRKCVRGTYRTRGKDDNCQPCPAGNTTDSNGSTSAADCNVKRCVAGEFISGDKCMPCPLDTYQPMDMPYSYTSCTSCNGSFNYGTRNVNSTNITDCKYFCSAGYENVSGSCTKCKRGFYKDHAMPEARWGPCVPCSDKNRTTDMEGSTSNSSCAVRRCVAGEFISSDRCTPCPLDTFQPIDMPYSNTSCTSCNITLGSNSGTRNVNSTNITDCKVFCPAGYENISGSCTPCKRGFYKDHSMLVARWESCVSCSDKTRTTDMEGSTSNSSCVIRKCVAGEFVSSDQCMPCPLDTFQPVDMPYSNTSCTPCNLTSGSNSGTRNVNSTNITDCKVFCPAGYENVSGSCTPCKRGFYKDHSMSEARWGSCVSCSDKNRTTDMEGSTSNSSCVIWRCVAGEFISSDRCTPCPLDTFQPMDMPYSNTSCTPCNITLGPNYGTRNVSSTSITDCKDFCPAGYENISGSCTPCKRGFYKDHSMSEARWGSCVSCSDKNRTTDMEGSTSNSSCVIRRCVAGEFISGDKCMPCLLDTYQPVDMPYSNTNCTPCNVTVGPNYGTMTAGSTNTTDCKPFCSGGQQFDNATMKCAPCPMGYYKPAELRFDSCLKCRENYTTSRDGQTSNTSCNIRDCPKGTFISGGDCIYCPYAMYQDLPRQNSCIECGPNLNTSAIGAVSRNDCTIWCGPGQEGSNTCTLCPEDKIKPAAGYGQCVSCDPNKDNTANMNRTVCDVLYCRMGYYNNSMTCIQCAAGTYKSKRGNTACLDCPAGNTSMKGGIDCPLLHCVPGKTLDMNNQACVECPKGSWKSEAGNMSCTPCNSNWTTESTGSNSSDKCDTVVCGVGQYRNSSKKSDCENCPLGTYQDEKGQTTCKNCVDGNITLDVGSDDPTDCVILCVAGQQYNIMTRKCDPCPRGFYKAVDGNAQNGQIIPCDQCPSGNTTLSAGSSRLDDCNLVICKPGSYQPEGHSSCHLCPIGQYQFASDQTKCLSCANNYTTSEFGSTSNTSCIRDCRTNGGQYYSNGICVPCPIGQYREPDPNFNKTQDGCILCGSGTSTIGTGGKSQSECLPVDPEDQKEPNISSVSFSFTMTFTSNTQCSVSNKGIIRTQIEMVIYAQFRKKGQVLCKNNCANILVSILSSCGGNRRKRQANRSIIVFDIQVQNVSAVVNETTGNQTVQRTAESVLSQTLQDPATYTVVTETLTLTLENITVPNKTINCDAGQQLDTTLNACESCPAGTRGELARICVPCESGTYQNLTGQTKCIPCVEPKPFTQQNGSTSVSQCKSICQRGSYWNEGNSSCSLCPLGEYQFASDQTKCLSCGINYTTSELGSTSNTSCFRDCRTKGGEYLKNGICVPCPIGQYREPDPTFKMQDGCILCGSGTSTTQTGSTSQTHCLAVDPKDRKEPNITSVSFSFTMAFTSNTQCSESNKGVIRNQIESVIYAQFRKKGQGLCRNNCANILVSISSSCGSIGKRQADNILTVPVEVQNVSAVLNDTNGNQRTAESVLSETLQNAAAYTVENGSLALTLKNTTVPVESINCDVGQQLNTTLNSCESCPAGSKGELAGICVLCESRTYQNLTGQTKCIPCVEPKPFTQQTGSTSVSQCKSLCEVELGYCNNRGDCTPSGQSATCDCKSDYTGSRCETRAVPKSNQDAILGGSIGGGVGFLTLILIVVGCYVCLTREVKKDKNDKRSMVSQGDNREMEFFRNPIYDNGLSGPYPAQPYPGYANPEIEYNPYHQQSDVDIPAFQERPHSQYEEDNARFVWELSA